MKKIENKRTKKILIIIGVVILVILVVIVFYIYFATSIINNVYINFGYHDTVAPQAIGYNSGFEQYYIDDSGFIVKKERNSGMHTIIKYKILGKLSNEELDELENYIMTEVEKLNYEESMNSNKGYNSSSEIAEVIFGTQEDTEWTVTIKNKLEYENKDLVLNLINKITDN